MSIVIKFLAAIGAISLCVVLIVFSVIMKSRLQPKIDAMKLKRKRNLRSKHKIKISTFCCECENWGGEKEANKPNCPMRNYCTGEFEFCSRGVKS